METKKLTYEAPEAQVFGVETQNCFASGFASEAKTQSMSIEDVDQWDS